MANLLLARAAARRKEIGVRLALGASRWRLIRQLLTESVMLAGMGGAFGILFALWIKDGLLAVSDWGPKALEPRLDWRVLGFTLALSMLTGIVFGIVPAWRATKVDLAPSLKDNARGSSAASRSLLSRGLVVTQVALSLLLLIGAGLFLRTLLNLQRVEPGFNTRNLLLFGVQPGLIGYKDEKLTQLYQQMAERIEAVPGAQAVTFSRMTLLVPRFEFARRLPARRLVRPARLRGAHQAERRRLRPSRARKLFGDDGDSAAGRTDRSNRRTTPRRPRSWSSIKPSPINISRMKIRSANASPSTQRNPTRSRSSAWPATPSTLASATKFRRRSTSRGVRICAR